MSTLRGSYGRSKRPGLGFVGYLGALVQDRFAEMCSVTWRAVPVNEAMERDEIGENEGRNRSQWLKTWA